MTNQNSEIVNSNNVTTKDFWNRFWMNDSSTVAKVNPHDFYFGKNGLFVKLICNRVGNLEGKSVIEFGGGGQNFRLLSFAKWLKAKVTAVDFSDVAIEKVKRVFEENSEQITIRKFDLTAQTPENVITERFDLATHWGFVEHFRNPKLVLQMSYEVLQPDGQLIFSMPNMEGIGSYFWSKWCPQSWSHHVWHSDEQIEQILLDVGFKQVEKFHFGIPFVKLEPWETKVPGQIFIDGLQKLLSLSARVFPIFHRFGHSSISMERGFLAKKNQS